MALLGVIAVAVIAGGVGWYAGQQIRSPEQIAADTAAPEPSLITVPVESRTLSRDVITRANAEFLNSEDLTLDLAAGGAGGAAALQPVVTGRVPEVGDEISEGTLALEIAGRPVFVFEGDLPSFRSIGPGTTGVDVLQLEESLLRLGYFVGVADESFDDETESAIHALYAAQGYDAPELTEAEENQLEQAADAVERATDAIETATDRLDTAVDSSERSESQVLQSGQSLSSAQRSVGDAEYALISVNISHPLSDIGAAESDALRANGELVRARQQLDAARLAQVSGEQLGPLEAAVEGAEMAFAQAQGRADQLASARDNALRNANASVVRAREQLALAELQAVERLEPTDFSDEHEAIADAEEDLEAAEADLDALESEIGTVLPQSEFMFVANLPRLISRIDVEPGQTVTESVMRISGDDVTFTGGVPEISRQFVTVGSTVVIDDAGTGIEIQGVIAELADNPGTNGQPDSRYYFEVLPNDTFDSEAVVNVGNFRMTIPIERTEGEVLSVPIAALSAGADGSSRVEVARDDGTTELVEVIVGLEAEGFVEVEPVGQNLEPGKDRVVIGVDRTGIVAGNDDSVGGADDGSDGDG